jgi:hypothetical protein
MRLPQISHLLNKLSIPTIPHVFSNSQSLIANIKNRIYLGNAVAHTAIKYNLATDMDRDREIELSYVLTAAMLADCVTMLLPKPAFVKQCAAMGMIRIRLGNYLEIGIGSVLRSGHANGIGTGKGIGNAIGK